MPRSLQNPPQHDLSTCRVENHDSLNTLNSKELLNPPCEDNIEHDHRAEDQLCYCFNPGIQHNLETPDEPQHIAQQSFGEKTQNRLKGEFPLRLLKRKPNIVQENIEATKNSARERYETYHARMAMWNNFAKGLNCSMKRAYVFLSLGEHDNAEQVFERVIRTTDEFLRNNSS